MKIGFIAMSGIRACDEELLRMGLTLPGFVERSRAIASLPSLGLLTLAGMTPARHEVTYMEVPDLRDLHDLPQGLDLVAISSFSAQIDEAYALSRRLRALGTRTVLGGLHVTALPDEAAEHCDAVVIGEGESCWEQVVADAQQGRLQPRYDGRETPFDLAHAPMPAFHLLDIDKYNRITVQTSRGCPHRCDFCAGSILLTNKYKQKPIDKVLAEIDRVVSIWDRPFLEFADDNSFVNRAYWKELLRALRGKGLRWFTETDLAVAQDEELLALMRESGCAQVLIGLESPVGAGLQGLELRNDWKYKRLPHYKEAIAAIQGHGITVNGCFILGRDGHTSDIFDEVFDFVREAELYEVQITIQTAFPGTSLYDRLLREGRLIEPRNWRTCTLFDVNYVPSHMTAAQLADGFKGLVGKLYSDEFTRWRKGRYMHNLRQASRRRKAVV